MEEIPSYLLSPYHRMRKMLKRKTYLSWPRAGEHTELFWEKLCQALETREDPEANMLLLTVSTVPWGKYNNFFLYFFFFFFKGYRFIFLFFNSMIIVYSVLMFHYFKSFECFSSKYLKFYLLTEMLVLNRTSEARKDETNVYDNFTAISC